MPSIKRYAPYQIRVGQKKPAVMVLQECFNKLLTDGKLSGDTLTVDGIFGPKTDGIVKAFQAQLGVAADGIVGKDTWGAIVAQLPEDWRPTLRFRLATLEDTYENGPTNNSFGASNVVAFEGWPNFGIWNVNYQPGEGSIAGSSLGMLLKVAGRTDLYSADRDTIAEFFGTAEGRHAQLYSYFDQYILGPALAWLQKSGFPKLGFSASELPDKLDPVTERLVALSVDIAVNSGPGGYAAKRVPRVWDQCGQEYWDVDMSWDAELPDRDGCMAAFEKAFGCKIPSPHQQFDFSVDSRDTYLAALKDCLWNVCTDDQQRVNLIADLQGRVIWAKPIYKPRTTIQTSTLQAEVTKRRRTVARANGWNFQDAHFCLTEQFGIGG